MAVGAGDGFSLYAMFLAADPVVKAVMAGLALASVASWAIILEKIVRLARLRRDLALLERVAQGAADGASARGLVQSLLRSAESEAEDGGSRGEDRSEVRVRLERAMRATLKCELQRQEQGLPFLATVGSAAPFVGLFGTVWGIMNSFTAIGQQQDTSLATVAPGIAEALFATALGLAAAIPAVMAYNAIAVSLGRSSQQAGVAIAGIAKALSRPPPDNVVRVAEQVRAGKGH